MKESVVLPPEVKRVYSLINKATGAIGGNGESRFATCIIRGSVLREERVNHSPMM